jgi:hypothetical protein
VEVKRSTSLVRGTLARLRIGPRSFDSRSSKGGRTDVEDSGSGAASSVGEMSSSLTVQLPQRVRTGHRTHRYIDDHKRLAALQPDLRPGHERGRVGCAHPAPPPSARRRAACARHDAADVVQTALARCDVAWSKVSRADNRDAYVYRTLVHALRDSQRRHGGESGRLRVRCPMSRDRTTRHASPSPACTAPDASAAASSASRACSGRRPSTQCSAMNTGAAPWAWSRSATARCKETRRLHGISP